ncbi:ParB N-terminal domain-containing protein [Ruminococcus sp.]|jgi:ParB family chromosome partitioning protein|uniref:ParB/RepB/Spo0J family partition protein n=1 Tax=Ruminococcus sp. TaxID=41978 RepID=UPI0025D51ECC|nr:ParB N-terminal domain-containing protein [Ruminococcus sp.]
MAKKFNPTNAADRFAKLGDEAKKAKNKADRTEMIPISSIIMNEDNVFSANDTDEEIQSLAENIKENGLIHNITVAETSPDQYLLISGERRTKAMKYLGRDTIKANIKSGLSEFEILKLLFFANSETREYSTEEKIHIINDFKEKIKRFSINDKASVSAFNSYVSEAFNIHPRQASKLISISSELSEGLKELLFSDIIDINTAAAFAQLPEDYQDYAADLIAAGNQKDTKGSVQKALDFTKLSKNVISKSNNSLSKNKASYAYYSKRLESTREKIPPLTIMLSQEGTDEEAIFKQINDLNEDIRKYEKILKELDEEKEKMLQLQGKDIDKIFKEFSKSRKKSQPKPDDTELISKEVQKLEASVKKLMGLAPSKELEKISSLIEKYRISQDKN